MIEIIKLRVAYELAVEKGWFKKGKGSIDNPDGTTTMWHQREDFQELLETSEVAERLEIRIKEIEKSGKRVRRE